MSDTHIANLLKYVKDRDEWYGEEIVRVIKEETVIRGFTETFINGAPYPYSEYKNCNNIEKILNAITGVQ
ncbi:MAG: hypothetical protein M0Q13_11640 [Methanothrix sp.]|jgi:hypothetical protein|nr:hypothetical protein [Methanothrix sp.]